jgi:hypothetical protein
VPVLAAVVADLPFLPRYFTSEDFLLLRFLREQPPWNDWGSAFGAPWLGITAVGFYRPISTAWFALEGALFGGHPLPYNLAHLAVHAANTVLLAAIARRLGAREREAAVAATLFAIYPLHPNTVLFIGSFATLFGALFCLLSVWLFLGFLRPAASLWGATGAAASFLLALGSYEACVVLPVWAGAAALIQAPPGGLPRRRAGGMMAVLGLLVGAYLIGRQVLFGGVGGYGDLAAVWSHGAWWPVSGAVRSLDRLAIPHIVTASDHLAVSFSRLAVLGAVLWAALRLGSREDRRWSRRLLGLSMLWVLAALAPFAFQPVPPGAGRYWYFASAALSLGLGLPLCRAASSMTVMRWVPRAALLSLAIGWALLRIEVGDSYREAGRTARSVQLSLAAAIRGAAGPCLVAGVPGFVERHGIPYAQVFHYGLSDSLRPPFSPAQSALPAPVVLPVLSRPRELALLRGAPSCRLAWRADLRSFEKIAPGVPVAELAVGLSGDSRWVRLRAVEGIRYQLVVAAPGNSTTVPLTPALRPGVMRAMMPHEFLQTMARLYGARFDWWVEGRDGAGELVAVSAYRSGRPIS